MLQSPDVPLEAKLFATTTMKGKSSLPEVHLHLFRICMLIFCETDHIRHSPTSSRLAAPAQGLSASPPLRFSCWTAEQSHPNATMCLSRGALSPNDGMEGCH